MYYFIINLKVNTKMTNVFLTLHVNGFPEDLREREGVSFLFVR